MKKLNLLLLACLLNLNLNAQFGDSNSEVENLTHLAKTWGFLKYFHPEVQECQLDWDQSLITSLTALDGADQSDYHMIVENLIDAAGEIMISSGTAPEPINEEELNNLELGWMQSDHFSNSIQEKLMDILSKSRERDHCLLEVAFAGGNLTFESEQNYASLGNYPDINYRLLAVFRYWNAINYFFPYKHIMDQNWDATLEQFILPIAYAPDMTTFHLQFKEFSTYINDSHSFFISQPFSQWRGIELAPFKVKHIENKTVIVAVDESVNSLEVGDIVLELDGQNIEDLRDDLYRNYDEYLDFHIAEDASSSWETITVDDCEFGYVHMGLLETEEILQMKNDLWDKDAIIFDIRNYPNGTLWGLMPHLFNQPIPIADFTSPNPEYAGQFYWVEAALGNYNSNPTFDGTMIILFNEDTQSQAEYTIMGLENHPNAIKIGSQTSGADGNVSIIDMPGNIRTYFTGLGVYYPDGTPTQRIGIVPDIEVKPTIEGIRNGKDEVLEYALDCSLLNYTSNHSVNENNALLFYPNPFQDNLTIDNQSTNNQTVQIFDILGNLVQEEIVQNISTLELSELANGLYIAQWKKGNVIHNQKLIKQ